QPRQTLVLAGVLIGGILDATCRTAYQLGYDVQILGDAALSMDHAERETYLGVVMPEFALVTTSTSLMAGAA
ncbi:MAG: isochorismatase family protein, partial [Phycisphaerales bacterium]|nr:isochorismatase family protein [Phycisphaerales bacterium]